MDQRSVVIHVRLTKQEHEELQRAAGDVPIGRYVRRKLFDAAAPAARETAVAPIVVNSVEDVQRTVKPPKQASKAGKTCEHGIERGFRCWQCGGLAKSC